MSVHSRPRRRRRLIRDRLDDGQRLSATEAAAATRDAGADVMLLWHEHLDEAAMAAGHAAGLAVGASAARPPRPTCAGVIGLGAVRMTSNYPDVFRRVVDEMMREA